MKWQEFELDVWGIAGIVLLLIYILAIGYIVILGDEDKDEEKLSGEDWLLIISFGIVGIISFFGMMWLIINIVGYIGELGERWTWIGVMVKVMVVIGVLVAVIRSAVKLPSGNDEDDYGYRIWDSLKGAVVMGGILVILLVMSGYFDLWFGGWSGMWLIVLGGVLYMIYANYKVAMFKEREKRMWNDRIDKEIEDGRVKED